MIGRLLPPVVLAYHAVATADEAADPHRLVLDPAKFDSQLRLLRRAGYRFTTAAALASTDGPPPRGTAVLTFDDGWIDAVTNLLPRLRSLGLPATFYVCPGWLGGQHPLVAGAAGRLVDRADVETLARAGMEVASHSMLHRDLRTLSDTDLEEDLVTSKQLVEDVTGAPCTTIAYPYGLYDPRVEAATMAAGYELGYAWRPGSWRSWRRSAVPRLPAPPRHGGGRLALKLLGARRSPA
ncbi:MAG TPA: polysaccharide deacetylase family protein [Acidimicrobiales bacterium]|nr:polysaccharide deacetylase family protein [Acidimicrobiales bacterium]